MDNGEETREQRIAVGAEGIKLDTAEVRQFVASLGYEAETINQHHRHVYGKIHKNGGDYFFKMASTPAVAPKLRNEIAWNNLINTQTGLAFRAPRILKSGQNVDLTYYIAEYVGGPLLATKTKNGTDRLAEELGHVVQIARAVNALPITVLPLDAGRTQKQEAELLVKSAHKKVELLRDLVDLQSLADLTNVLNDGYEPAMTHGDFTPWSMIKQDDGLVLFDGEHATSLRPKFIDAAQFYMRTCIPGENPETAKEWLQLIRENLESRDRAEFDRTIRALVAHRTINAWRDAQLGKRTSLQFHEKLKDDILDDNL